MKQVKLTLAYLIELLVRARSIHIAERVIRGTLVSFLKQLQCSHHVSSLCTHFATAQHQYRAVLVLELLRQGSLQRVQGNLEREMQTKASVKRSRQ